MENTEHTLIMQWYANIKFVRLTIDEDIFLERVL